MDTLQSPMISLLLLLHVAVVYLHPEYKEAVSAGRCNSVQVSATLCMLLMMYNMLLWPRSHPTCILGVLFC